MPPLAAGPHQVEQPVQQAPHVGRPRMASGFGGRNERFEQAVLLVAQGLTGPVIPNQRASLGRPHGGFFPGKPPRTLLLRHLFRPKFANGSFQNSLLHYLAGLERRAPVLVQKAGMEWAWRLAQNPKRLWRRYLVDDPAILRLLWREARGRR
jgi:hypothetical protein